MTKGRKGWMEGEMASRYVDDYLSTMRLLNIDPDGLANLVNYHAKRQEMNIQSRGLLGSDTVSEVHDVFDAEMRNARQHNRKRTNEIPTKFHMVKDYYDLYERKAWLEDPSFEPLGLDYLSDAQLAKIDSKLRAMKYGERNLSEKG
jgi:hypothetical protein